MDYPHQGHDLPNGDSGLQKASLRGGYHSRGVPGEEGEVRKRMRVLKVGDRSQRINKSRPLSGGTGAEQASGVQLEKGLRTAKWAAGARLAAHRPDTAGDAATSVFVIAKKGLDFLDTPVFHAGDSGDEEALALFTDRQRAQQYLDRAAWGETDEIGELTSDGLLQWLLEANREGIQYVTINPDRERHLAGEPQSVLVLEALGDRSPASLVQEVNELARS
jgi:hypothetical protein